MMNFNAAFNIKIDIGQIVKEQVGHNGTHMGSIRVSSSRSMPVIFQIPSRGWIVIKASY